jgi:hypothetical protein
MARSSALKMSFETEPGVIAPTGFWDPLGLAKDIDATTFTKYRTAELKHGRVAMLAVIGYLAAESFRFPGAIDLDGTTFASLPNGVDALKAINPFGWFQIGASIGFWEVFGWKQVEGSTPGDFGYTNQPIPAGKEYEYKTKELHACHHGAHHPRHRQACRRGSFRPPPLLSVNNNIAISCSAPYLN